MLSRYHVENASFVSLDNISIGYNFNLPKSAGFSKIRLYVAGNNLFYITGYKEWILTQDMDDIENDNNPLNTGR